MKQHFASFANFVCRFGKNSVLLDFAWEIVIPAFTDDKMVRSYGDTSYFFLDTRLQNISGDKENPELAIVGQFVKETVLYREQIFDYEKGLVKDQAALASAPSAFFILFMSNHRLIYFPETANAPPLEAFRSTSHIFIKQKHKKHIDNTFNEINKTEKITKKVLYERIPTPSIEVIPLSGNEEIETFVRRYKQLKKIEFRLVTPNDEIDGYQIFDELRDAMAPVQPKQTSLVLSNPEGLDIEEAIPLLKAASDTANQEIKLSGKDDENNDLKGDNKEFKLSVSVNPVPATRNGKITKLTSIFNHLLEEGSIKIGAMSQEISEKVNAIWEKANGQPGQ